MALAQSRSDKVLCHVLGCIQTDTLLPTATVNIFKHCWQETYLHQTCLQAICSYLTQEQALSFIEVRSRCRLNSNSVRPTWPCCQFWLPPPWPPVPPWPCCPIIPPWPWPPIMPPWPIMPPIMPEDTDSTGGPGTQYFAQQMSVTSTQNVNWCSPRRLHTGNTDHHHRREKHT